MFGSAPLVLVAEQGQGVSNLEADTRMDILMKVCYHFLGAVITQGKFAQSMLSKKPVCKFATQSDMTYAVLSTENHWEIWMEMARIWKEKGGTKWPDQNSKELQDKNKMYGSLSQPFAQQRFVEIQNKIKTLLGSDDAKTQFSDKFARYYEEQRGSGRKRKRSLSPEQIPSQPVYETDFLSAGRL